MTLPTCSVCLKQCKKVAYADMGKWFCEKHVILNPLDKKIKKA